MRRVLLLSAFLFCFGASVHAQSPQPASKAHAAQGSATPPASPAAVQAARASFAKLPLSFEENVGQTDARVKYTSRGAGYNLFLTPGEAVFALRGGKAPSACDGLAKKIESDCVKSPDIRPEESFLWLKMRGANASPQVIGTEPLPGKINYYIGNDPSKWRTGVRQYGRVTYPGIYPGVDLTYYGNQQQLESDFVVAPGANPRAIEFEIKGARETRLDPQGNLVLVTSVGNVQLLRPGIYQESHGQRREVAGRYLLRGKNRVGFAVGSYDRHEKLIIDPTLVFSTYLGGSNLSGGDEALSVAIDAAGHAFVTGQGESSDFPGTDSNGPPTESFSGFAFVTEFDPTGSSGNPGVLVYSTLLSGSDGGDAAGNGISVDGSGNAYIAGWVSSKNFPMVNPYQSTYGDPFQSGFLASVKNDGTLNYSTYFGGRNADDTSVANAIFADAAGNTYVTGETDSQNFPTMNSLPLSWVGTYSSATNVIVAKFNPQGQPLYSTYLNGTGTSSDLGEAIVVDAGGNAYVTGQTTSTVFPLQPASPAPFQAMSKTYETAFVAKLAFSGSTLSVANFTYLGGTGTESGMGIAIDTATPPNVYVTGQTTSTNFPTQGPISGTFTSGVYSGGTYGAGIGSPTDAFVTKLNGTFSALTYSTYLGGSGADVGYAIGLDASGNAYVTGSTASSNFPTNKPLQAALGGAGATNVFLAELNSTGNSLTYSTFLGGTGSDKAFGIAVDSTGNAYIAGKTTSANFPLMSGGAANTNPFQSQLGSSSGNAFVAKVSPTPGTTLSLFPSFYNFHEVGVGVAATEVVTLSNNTASAVTISSFAFGGTNSGDFTLTAASPSPCSTTPGFSLGAGASCLLTIQFLPSDQDARSGTFTVNGTPTMNLSGSGGAPQVSLSTTSITFFPNPDPLNVPSTSSVSITNTGGGPLLVGSAQLQPASAAPFSVQSLSGCSAPVPPSGSCTISLLFLPTTANSGNPFNATLLINDNAAGSPQSVSLTGTAKQEVIVQPTSLEFGLQVINSTSTNNSNEVGLVNGSGGPITLTLTAGTGPFQTDFHVNNSFSFTNNCTNGLLLVAGGTCELFLDFQPTGAGNTGTDGRTGSYTFAWNGAIPGSQLVNLMGTAVTGISLYTNTLTAGNEFVGFTDSFFGTEYLYNGTNTAITVTVALTGNNPGDFTAPVDPSCAPGGVVPANTYCRVDATFSPSAVGLRTATATFNYTIAGGGSGQLVLSLSGTGIPGPVIITTNAFGFTEQLSTLDFGSEIISTTTPEKVFQVHNIATIPLTIQPIAAPGNADFKFTADSTCPVPQKSLVAITIPGGSSCFIGVTFTPSTTGSKESTTFVVTDSYATNGNDSSSPHTLTVTGTGELATITISVTSGANQILDFGNVAFSPSPVPQAAIYLTNAGNTPTTINWTGGAPFLSATGSSTFSLITSGNGPYVTTCNSGTKVLPQGGSCVIGVTFTPLSTTVGEQTTSVTFTDTVNGGSPTTHTVTIQGNGVPQGKLQLTPLLFGSPGLSFDTVSGTTSAAQAITVTNTGSGPLTITSLSIPTFGSTTPFAITSGANSCAVGSVVPSGTSGNTCLVYITYAPQTTGSSFGQLSLQASLGNNVSTSTSAELEGTAVSGGLTLSPVAPINFGAVAVGSNASSAEYTLTNGNITSVTIGTLSVPAGYFLSDGCSLQVLTSGNECFFSVSFTPTSATSFNGNLLIPFTGGTGTSPFTVALQGSGSAAVLANPNPVVFQASLNFSSFGSVTIANGSASQATITAVSAFTGADAADFSIPAFGDSCFQSGVGAILTAAGGQCSISINFLTATPGNFSAQFTVSYSISGTPQTPITVNLSASIPSAQAVITTPTPPAALNYGNQIVNTQSQSLNVVITNSPSATAPLTINTITITPNDYALLVSGNGGNCFSVAAGASCTIPIIFTPSVAGTRNGTLTITDNSNPTMQTVSLTGVGIAGIVSATPTTMTFPSTNDGSTLTLAAIVSNTGAAVPLGATTFTGPYSLGTGPNACGSSLGAITGTCALYITFTPSGSGASPGTAVVHYGTGVGAGTITITLNGNSANPAVNVSPTSLTFGPQTVGVASSSQTVTLINPTNAAVTVSSTAPTITGTNLSDFSIKTNNCTGQTLPAMTGSWTVAVVFMPGAAGGTARSATLTISDSSPAASFPVTLSGTAIAPDVTVTKTHTGTFFVGQTGTYTITVTNTGTQATTGTTTSTDTLPTGLTFNSNTNSGAWSCIAASQIVTCTSSAAIGASGGVSAFNLVVNVAAAAAGTPTNSVTVTTAGDTGSTGKTATDQTTVSFPLPTITSLSPTSATAGAAGFTLTVNGTNYVSGSVVNFNGTATTTTFVSATQLTASITAAEIATAGTFNVTVANPAPGGGTSGNSTFTVNNPSPTVASLSPSSATVGGAAFTLTVNGNNFNHSSVATFNGTARATTFVSATQLTIQVMTGDIAALGSLPLFVTNPAPGGGTSTTVNLPVTNPPPTITTISPTSAIAGAAGFTLTVNGTGFVSGATVKFNGNSKTTTFVNSTQVTAAITAGDIAAAGTFNVTVTNPAPGGGTSGNSPFTVNNPVPTITSLSPTSALAGGAGFTLTVNGTNFNSSSVVNFNGTAATTTFVSATQITAAITAGQIAAAGTLNVNVTNPAPGGGASGNSQFTVNNPAPTITSLSPTSGTKGGTAFTLTVNGTGFVSTSVVNFNSAAKTTTFVSATQITASITAGDIAAAGTINVTVTNLAPGGGTSGISTFTVNNPVPAITSLSPASAIAGGAAFTLTVNGTNFVSGAVVSFNGSPKTTTFVSATQVTAAITTGDIATAGAFNVSVTNPVPGGGASGNSSFAVNNPVPAITSLSPSSAIVGGAAFTLTVNGTNFVSGAVVSFNGNARNTTFVSATQVTAAITTGDIATAGTFNVSVANPLPGGGASGNSPFAVNNPAPAITSLSPNGATAGGAGFTLTVNGTGFVSTSAVKFNGNAKTTTFVSSTQITAAILSSDITTVGPANVTVTNPAPGGGTTTNFVFTIASQPNPSPTLTSISPTSGVAGQAVNMTLTGTGFIAGSIVNFGSNGDTGGTASNGGTTITITIPAGQLPVGGPVNVSVTNPTPGGGTSSAQTFTIDNPAPAITTISPTSATVGGAAFTLTVNGTGFVSSSVVNFNGAARTTTFVSATQLTASITAPDIAAIGTFPVTVTNAAPGGGTSASSSFAVNNPAPTITSLSPTNATAGGAAFTLTVNGTGFVSGSVVKFNGASKTTTFVNATQVTAAITAPDIAAAGTFNVTVTNPAPGGGTSGTSPFTVNNPVPAITSLSPTSALAGSAAFTLTVNGTNFNSSSVVNFNGTAATTTFVSATQVTAAITAPEIASAGTFNVNVTNPAPGGGASGNSAFAVNNPAPTITTLSPASGSAGGAAFTLTVNGTGFVSTSVVKFNGTAATTTLVSSTQVTAAITSAEIATAGTFNVTVTNPAPGGGTSANSPFAVNNPVPTITSLSPPNAAKGGAAFTLTVNGTNFVSSSTVNFNGSAATTTFVSATQVTAAITAPQIASAGNFNVTVTNPAPGGGTSGNSPFAVNNPAPALTSLSPASAVVGGAGFTLTVNGTGFLSGATVSFNGNSRVTTFVSATQVTAAILATDIAAAGTFNVTVSNPAPTTGASTALPFTVNNPLPAITSLSPASATAGGAAFTLTVNGTSFVSTSVVTFNGTAATTTFVSATQVTAAITVADIATAGTFNVTVTNPAPGGGTSGNSSYTVNNPVPTITSLSPTSATKSGTAFTLTVNGTNLNSSSVVNFNGAAKTTTFVSATQVKAAITATDIATAGTFNVTVTNPAPGGGTTANQSFQVVGISLAQDASTAGTITVTAGTPAMVKIDFMSTPANAPFPSAITITCTLPSMLTGATCAASPTTIAAGATSGSTTVSINAIPAKSGSSGSSASGPRIGGQSPWSTYLLWLVAAVLLSMLGMLGAVRQRAASFRRAPVYLTLLLLVLAAGALVGCTTASGPTPTPTGPSTMTVTATTADGATVTTTVNITISN